MNNATNQKSAMEKFRSGLDVLKAKAQDAISSARSAASASVKKVNQAVRDHVGQPSYTDKIDAVRAEIDSHKRELRKLHHEIENLEVAMSNLSDDRNVAYYNSRKEYVKQRIHKEQFVFEELQEELESLIRRLKAEQSR